MSAALNARVASSPQKTLIRQRFCHVITIQCGFCHSCSG